MRKESPASTTSTCQLLTPNAVGIFRRLPHAHKRCPTAALAVLTLTAAKQRDIIAGEIGAAHGDGLRRDARDRKPRQAGDGGEDALAAVPRQHMHHVPVPHQRNLVAQLDLHKEQCRKRGFSPTGIGGVSPCNF